MPKAKVANPVLTTDTDEDTSFVSSDNILLLIEKLTANFTTSFNVCVDKIVDSIGRKFEQRLECNGTEIFNLNKKIEALERQNKSLETTNVQLNERICSLNTKIETLATTVDELDQYSRGSNLMVHGIPLMPTTGGREDNLTQHVVQLLNTNLGTTISDIDISVAHRIGRPPGNNTSSSGAGSQSSSTQMSRPPPVIIQFSNKRVRNTILGQRKRLKGKPMTITEQLTARRASLLKKCTELVTSKRLESAWSHEGRILVRSLNQRTTVITKEQDLIQF
jgi:hypothetical protein